jgi:hypothetical protein
VTICSWESVAGCQINDTGRRNCTSEYSLGFAISLALLRLALSNSVW